MLLKRKNEGYIITEFEKKDCVIKKSVFDIIVTKRGLKVFLLRAESLL